MFWSISCFLLLFSIKDALALPISSLVPRQSSKPPYFLLVGDSTTAKPKEASYGITGGWGDGFLALLNKPASGVNYGHNGRTTIDYRSGGDFDKVIKDLKANKDKKDVFVTIQVCEKWGGESNELIRENSLDTTTLKPFPSPTSKRIWRTWRKKSKLLVEHPYVPSLPSFENEFQNLHTHSEGRF
jgi:hypothetical protein